MKKIFIEEGLLNKLKCEKIIKSIPFSNEGIVKIKGKLIKYWLDDMGDINVDFYKNNEVAKTYLEFDC